MQRFLPFKEDLCRNLRSVGKEDGTWGLPSTETGKAPLTANRIKALEKEVANLRTLTSGDSARGGRGAHRGRGGGGGRTQGHGTRTDTYGVLRGN
jgi:hypothetical protein